MAMSGVNHLRTGNGRYHGGRGGTFIAKNNRIEKHKCFLPGCECQISKRLLFCPEHWHQVPEHIQQEVSATYEEFKYWPGDRDIASRYSAARRAAVQAIQQKEKQGE